MAYFILFIYQKMAPFIRGFFSKVVGKSIYLDSSDVEGSTKLKRNHKGESSSQGQMDNYKSRMVNNGSLSEVRGKMANIDDMIVELMVMFPRLSLDQALDQVLKAGEQLSQETVLQFAIDHFLQHGVSDTDTNLPEEDENIGREIECGCCCIEFPFEKMVQCADGHLFCSQCLRKHVEESTFGSFQSHTFLPCMDTNGCKESIPMSEIQRTLPADIIGRYEQRQAQADIEQAKLKGLVYCPFCDFPYEVDKGMRVLECLNPQCSKESCIQCKETSHVPLRCEEVEKKSETALRRRIEEEMAKAVIRECNSCKTELVKKDGCNKVTCRCGTTMCYKCRKTILNNYSHFCQHPRVGGRPCHRCDKCGVWEEEVDDKVALAAQKKALKKLAEKEPKLLERSIGPQINIKKNHVQK